MSLSQEDLKQKLIALQKAHADLQTRYEALNETVSLECTRKEKTIEQLRMSQMIIEKSPVILFRRLGGDNPKLVYVSDNIKQFGYSAEAFLNGEIEFKEIVHPDDYAKAGDEITSHTFENTEEFKMIYRIVTRNGDVRWVEDQTSIIKDEEDGQIYNQGVVVDITEKKLAEDRLKKNEEKFRRIIETTGEGFLMMDDELKIVDVNEAYCKMLGYQREEILGKTPLDLATDDFRQFMRVNRDRILAMDYRKFEGKVVAKNGAVVPVLIHGNTVRDEKGKTIGNVAFVSDLTEQKKAMALAGKVQQSLIPEIAPKIKGFDIAGRSHACDEVGGDYFDFLYGSEFDSNNLKVVIGDISGHGVDAALLMTSARTYMRMCAAQPGSLPHVVSSMNRHLSADMADTGHFMTLFLIEIDPKGDGAHWVRAGHDPALLYLPEEDRMEELKGKGIPLGIDVDYSYEENHIGKLTSGSIVALITDGIWESTNPDGEIFGKERISQVIREYATQSAAEIVSQVFSSLAGFTQGVPCEDDLTLVIIKVD